ncbi:MAG: GyrI-like domain-containing protein [Pseudomonadota bacterium]
MQKISVTIPEIRLLGITARTNNTALFEADPSTNVVASTVQKYFHSGLPALIPNRSKSDVTYCVYTEYESDFNGDFTYFIGEEVDSLDEVPEGFTALTIPSQTYAKFTSDPGPMPAVCIDLWKDIWDMTSIELGGERGYIADFEVYDERASDHQNVVLDIYIGVKA